MPAGCTGQPRSTAWLGHACTPAHSSQATRLKAGDSTSLRLARLHVLRGGVESEGQGAREGGGADPSAARCSVSGALCAALRF